MNRVQKEIHCSTSASQEGTPPPMIILQLSKALKISETLPLGTLYNKLHWNTQTVGKDLVMVRIPLQSDFSLNKIVFKNYIDKFWVPNIAENGWSFVLNIRHEAHRMRVPACCRRLGLAPARQSNLQTHAGERWSFVDFLSTCTKENQFFHCTWELL